MAGGKGKDYVYWLVGCQDYLYWSVGGKVTLIVWLVVEYLFWLGGGKATFTDQLEVKKNTLIDCLVMWLSYPYWLVGGRVPFWIG